MVAVFSESQYKSNGSSQTEEKVGTNDSSDKNLRLSNSYVILARLIVDRSCLAVLQLRNYVIGQRDTPEADKKLREPVCDSR